MPNGLPTDMNEWLNGKINEIMTHVTGVLWTPEMRDEVRITRIASGDVTISYSTVHYFSANPPEA